MTLFCRFIRFFVLSLLVAVTIYARNFENGALAGFRYGPNLSWVISGNTPVVWGQWLPQGYGSLHYTWVEPLDTLSYGEKLGRTPSYWRMDGAVELTPFYGGYVLGMGIRPLATKLFIELNMTYESYLYFKSNLEMVTADVKGEGRIAETWNADYIVDNIYSEDAKFDYAQLIDMNVVFGYTFPRGSTLGFSVHYILSDISTDYDGKSYDYKRNIPVFSRDFLVVVENYGRWHINDNFALLYETSGYRTGYLRSKNTVQKEALSYAKVLIGGQFSWNKGMRSLTAEVGGWRRLKDRFYDGSFAQCVLLQVEYTGYFSFPFRKNID